MPLPDVSVVLPLHNGARWIGATLDAIAAQTHAPREVVVVDDRSADGGSALVAALAAERPAVRLVASPGRGPDDARRHGIALTAAPLVALLDQDDLWHPDHLRRLAAALHADAGAPAAVAGLCPFDDGTLPAFDVSDAGTEPADPWERFPAGFYPTPSGVVMRRAALDAAGGWPVGVEGVADMGAWLLLGAARPLVQVRAVTVGYRLHAASHAGVLRRERVLDYAAAHVAASESAVRHRTEVRPDAAASAEQRLGLARAFRGIVGAVVRGSADEVRAASIAMERSAAGEPDVALDATLDQAFWHLAPLFAPKTAGRTWALLAGAWAPGARRTGARLHRRLPARVVAHEALRRPGIRAWRALAAHGMYVATHRRT